MVSRLRNGWTIGVQNKWGDTEDHYWWFDDYDRKKYAVSEATILALKTHGVIESNGDFDYRYNRDYVPSEDHTGSYVYNAWRQTTDQEDYYWFRETPEWHINSKYYVMGYDTFAELAQTAERWYYEEMHGEQMTEDEMA